MRFKQPTTLIEARTALDGKDYSVAAPLVPALDIFLVKLRASVAVSDALAELRQHPLLLWAQADHVLTLRATPNDPQFPLQWNLSQESDADIDAPEAWDYATGGRDPAGEDIVVAVVDGGCLLSHQDLSENLWVNRNEIAGNGRDDDGNGYVDDIHGWNAYANSGTIPVSNHGTHVAGIVGARGGNGILVCGVNWNVKLMLVAASSTLTSVVAAGYNYVLVQKQRWWESNGLAGANVVATNSSFGVDLADCASGDYPIWNDLYNALGSEGVLSACATANANRDVDSAGDVPTGCSSPFIISVTSTNSSDARHTNAAYGDTTIDLGAPGTNIRSTTSDNSTGTMTGTSMASPHVAGAIALMHAAASAGFHAFYLARPDSAALALKDILLQTVDPLPSLQGFTVSGGRLNLQRAVESIRAFPPQDSVGPLLYCLDHSINDTVSGNGDGMLEAGEIASLAVVLHNSGSDAASVSGVLSCADFHVTILDSTAVFGDMGSGQTTANTYDAFTLRAHPDTPLEHTATLILRLYENGVFHGYRFLTLFIGRKVIYWSDSVETGTGAWTHEAVLPGFGDNWHITTQRAASPVHAWKCGDTLSGPYANRLDAALTTPPVLLTPESELLFRHWMQSETAPLYPDSAYDGGVLEISVADGPFVPLLPVGGYPKTFRRTRGNSTPYSGPMPGRPCFAGSFPWVPCRVDLAAYSGQVVRFRFRFGSDATTGREGWYIDDIVVRGRGSPPPALRAITDLIIVPHDEHIVLHWSAPDTGSLQYRIYRAFHRASAIEDFDLIDSTANTTFVDSAIVVTRSRAFYLVTAVRP